MKARKKSAAPARAPDDFRLFRYKLLGRAAATVAVIAAVLLFLYYNMLEGRGILTRVGGDFLEVLFFGNEKMAANTYQWFRENRAVVFVISVAGLFMAAVSVYIRGVSKYFREISRGIDALLQDDDSKARLSPELEAVERKLNSAKDTLRSQRRELLEEEQRKNDLIMYLAHDLKTPLASVIGYLTLMRDEPQISKDLRARYLGITLDKAERLEDLINEFFEITRFNLSRVELVKRELDLARLLEQLSFEFGPQLREKGLTCTLSLPEALPLTGDGDKLRRVFDNLLRNAVLYSPEGGEIGIDARLEGSEAVVRITNPGDIPPEKLDRLFEQFYRLDASRSTRTGGAGLGLSIARQITELHGGTVTAVSKNGITTFTVRLPVRKT